MQFKARFQNRIISIILRYVLMVIFFVTIIVISSLFSQNDFYSIFPIFTCAFCAYLYLVFQKDSSFQALFWLGILTRLAMMFFEPSLSDDIYRFYWDGLLINQGINPYGVLPTEAIEFGIEGLNKDLFDQLNSPGYYTIYPPISQLYFAVCALANDIFWSSILMKLVFVLTEILGLWYLLKLLKLHDFDPKKGMIYFLNPLIILEGVGNLHFEVIMIAFFAISIHYLFKNRFVISAILMGVSIGVKLLPLMILPYFLFRLERKIAIRYFTTLFLTCAIIFIPVFGGIEILSFLESIDFYFQKFEFNASIYYVLRSIGEYFTGYNLIKYIGPILAIIVLSYNVKKAKESTTFDLRSFASYVMIVWTIYLFCATTVHPWYVAMLVFMSTFSYKRYAVAWSYLIFISYINYSQEIYYENLAWIALEYGLLFGYIYYEYIQNRKSQLTHG